MTWLRWRKDLLPHTIDNARRPCLSRLADRQTTTSVFGLAQRVPPPHRVFPRRLIAVTGRTPGGLLTPARCAELEAALAILQLPRRSRRPMKKTACFHDCVTRTTLPRSVRSHWSKNSSALTTSRNDTVVQSRPCATMARRRGPRPPKLRGHLAALRALYQRHIDVEDRELFPAAARLLCATQIADIGREMAERRSGRVVLTT